MSVLVQFTRNAELDVELAALDYELERDGLGDRFLDELDHVVARIEDGPKQFPAINGDVRRALLRHFPYGVYFLLANDEVLIVAVLHLHRHPETWKNRLP